MANHFQHYSWTNRKLEDWIIRTVDDIQSTNDPRISELYQAARAMNVDIVEENDVIITFEELLKEKASMLVGIVFCRPLSAGFTAGKKLELRLLLFFYSRMKGGDKMWYEKISLEKSLDVLADRLTHRADWYINCAGYAFGVDGWYCPYANEEAWEMYRIAAKSQKWGDLEQKLAARIVEDFPEWEETTELKEGNEYVAFRIRREAFFCDFHFMKFDGVKWTNKHGHSPVDTEWFKLEDIYEPEAWDVYDGRLFLFKKKV